MIRTNIRTVREQDGETQWRTLDQYNQSYWCGLDTTLLVNGVFLDELVGIRWELQEAVRPLYNYSSYTYARTIRGARRVSGMFTINFKQANYIYNLLSSFATTPSPSTVLSSSDNKALLEANRIAKSGVGTLEDFLALATAGSTVKSSTSRHKLDMSRVSALAAEYEKALLGNKPPSTEPGKATSARTSPAAPKFGVSAPVDFTIRFGSQRSDANYVGTLSSSVRGETGTVAPSAVSTAIVLRDVQIIGRSVDIDDSGRPTYESYQFLARDVS